MTYSSAQSQRSEAFKKLEEQVSAETYSLTREATDAMPYYDSMDRQTAAEG